LEHVSELITLGHWSKLDEYLCGYLVDRLSNGIDQDAIIDLLFAIRSQKLMDALNEYVLPRSFMPVPFISIDFTNVLVVLVFTEKSLTKHSSRASCNETCCFWLRRRGCLTGHAMQCLPLPGHEI
jgi:hypothetical protein